MKIILMFVGIIINLEMEKIMEKDNLKSVVQKFYSFFYFMFWGFYYSAGYLFCKKLKNTFLMSF